LLLATRTLWSRSRPYSIAFPDLAPRASSSIWGSRNAELVRTFWDCELVVVVSPGPVALSPAACRTPTSLSLDCFLGSGHMPPSSERALRKASELCRDVRYCLLMLMHWQHSCPLAPSPIEWGRPHGHVMLITNLGSLRRAEAVWNSRGGVENVRPATFDLAGTSAP
jgi:hypothetical protein